MLKVISQVSQRFLAGEPVDEVIDFALGAAATLLGCQRSYLFRYSKDQAHVSNTHEWCAPGIPSQKQQFRWVSVQQFAWLHGKLLRGLPVVVERVADLEVQAERSLWQSQGIQSIIYVPTQIQGLVYGVLGMETLTAEHGWQEQELEFLAALGELITLAQTQAEQAQLLQMAFQSARMGAWDWNMITGEEHWSPEMSLLLGRDPQTVCSYEDFLACVHPEDREVIETQQRLAQENQTQYRSEYRVIWPDGSIRWLTSIGNFQRDFEGNPIKLSGVSFDITERKQQEESLQQQREFMRHLIDGSPDLILVKTMENRLMLANKAVSDFYGVTREEIEQGWDERHRYSPEVIEQFIAENRWVVEHDQPMFLGEQLETNCRGEQRWMRWLKKALRVPGYDQPCIQMVGFDITDLKQIQLYAQANERLFRGVFDHAPIGIVIDTLESQTIEANTVLQQMLGYSLEELKQITYEDYTHPEDLLYEQQLWQELLEGKRESYTLEKRCFRKDGQMIWVLLSVSLLLDADDKPYLSLGMLQDITEQRKQREFLQQIIDVSSDLIAVRDHHHQLITCNKSYQAFCGLSLEELMTRDPETYIPSHIWQITCQENEQVVRTGQSLVTDARPQANAQGEIRFIRWTKAKITHPTHPFPCVLQIGSDVTEIKRAELEQRQAREAADLANRAKSAFLATMSHELRTPLNGILGYAQILRRDPQLSERQREGVRVIENCGNHLLTLINDLLDLAKIEAERLELDPQPFCLKTLIADLAAMTEVRADQKGIGFRVERQGTCEGILLGDAKRLKQVLLNLLSNAIKFTQQGQVSFRICGQPQADTLRLRFQVQDTGVGIPKDKLGVIFLPFEQVGELQQRSEGTGLGLAIASRLMQMMQGSLTVSSELGQGSTFQAEVELPLVQVAAVPVALQPAEQLPVAYQRQPDRGSYRVLIADDRPDNRSVLVGLLEPLGFEVLSATQGQEAWAILEHQPVDLVITDLIMPVMDGFELLKQIKATPALAQIPVIAASASVIEFQQSQSWSLGFFDFLPKPIQAATLYHLLEQALGLTWVYPATSTPPPAPVVMPPQEDLQTLYEAASIGRLQTIQTLIQDLANRDPAYIPFRDRIQQWVNELDDEAILNWLSPHLSVPANP
ncbi:MAG: PAS domain S-box protein [Thermostichales cyanobacterium HHBFW_bins_127]